MQLARRRYSPEEFHAQITLVRGDFSPASNETHRLQWSNVASEVSGISFGGYEDDMFRLPEVAEIAHIVDAILAESKPRS